MVIDKKIKKSKLPDILELKKHIKNRLKFINKIETFDKRYISENKVISQKSKVKKSMNTTTDEFIKTGIPGFDILLGTGIPKGSSILLAGGAGSGKTIFGLQTITYGCLNGETSLYISFEEPEERLWKHMENFGWGWKEFEKKGLLKIIRKEPFILASNIEAMLEKAKGELLIDINEILEIIPKGFKPDRIVVDSLSAIGASFVDKQEGYRIFIEQLFRYFESLNATTFFISETEQVPSKYSETGVGEFLADGVIVLYNIKSGNTRTSAIEVLKMRGIKIEKKIVPFQIISGKGIEVFPEESVFDETS